MLTLQLACGAFLILLPKPRCGATSDAPFPDLWGDARRHHFRLGNAWHSTLYSITDQVLVLTLIFLALLCIHYKISYLNFLFIFILYSRCGFGPKKYVDFFFFLDSMALNSYFPSPRLLQHSDFRLGDSTVNQHYKHFL